MLFGKLEYHKCKTKSKTQTEFLTTSFGIFQPSAGQSFKQKAVLQYTKYHEQYIKHCTFKIKVNGHDIVTYGESNYIIVLEYKIIKI